MRYPALIKLLSHPPRFVRRRLLQGVGLIDKLERSIRSGFIAAPRSSDCEVRDVGIVVTTFEQRQANTCLPLIRALREGGVDFPITVVINGNLSSPYDHLQRTDFVRKLMALPNVNVVGFRSITALSRMWNLGIQSSDTEVTIVLNDDLAVDRRFVEADLSALANSARENHLALGSVGYGSFSHFAIAKSCIQHIGWFDERFVGFGDEDQDYFWRYEDHFGTIPPDVFLRGVSNLDDPSNSGHVKIFSKYSLSTHVYQKMKYNYGEGTVKGRFQMVATRRLPEVNPYPLYLLHQRAEEIMTTEDQAHIGRLLRDLAT